LFSSLVSGSFSSFLTEVQAMNKTLTIALAALFALLGAQAQAGISYTPNDYDGDGAADLAVYYADGGAWYIAQSHDASLRLQPWGWSEARPVIGDFDGDGKSDVAVFNRESDIWYILESASGQLRSATFGAPDARAVPGDYDGDDKTDLAVYQRFNGTWLILQSSNGQTRQQQFGWSDARPVPADYDGDGRTDLAVFDRATGNWYILRSSDSSVETANWGWNQARPVAADYDGDGKADLAVYHPASGDWYIRRSIDGQLMQRNWGWFEAKPAPADYDGDGKTDLAVYHRRTGDWYVHLSATEALRLQNWGWNQAAAIPGFRDGGIEGLIILAFGDSITYGTSSSSESPATGYPILLEREAEPGIGGHFITINAGNPGESTNEGKQRLPTWLDLFHPDLTLLMEGTNDTFFEVPPSTLEANLRSMVSMILASGSDAILATIPPVIKSEYRDRTAQEQRIEAFNPRIYEIAADFDIRVAQVWEAITSVPGWQMLLMDQETANHPNDAGYRVVRDAFLAPLTAGTIAGEYY
jgi:lysophospholipase L1-like esterase